MLTGPGLPPKSYILLLKATFWPLWAAGLFLALVYISPGFITPLLYLQTDTLKFSTPYIGLMETIVR